MRPIHIVILMLAGALGGAALMKVVQRPTSAVAQQQASVAQEAPASTPAPAVQPPPVQSPPVQPAAPAAETAPPVAPAPETTRAVVVETRKPSPMKPAQKVREERESRIRPVPVQKRTLTAFAAKPAAPAVQERPVAVAPAVQERPAAVAPPPVVAPAVDPQPAPRQEPPVPVSPPARTEPEVVTPPPAPPAPEPNRATLNAGMLIPVRLLDGLSSERNVSGDAFTATLDHELVADGFVIAERGARVDGRVVDVDRGTKVKGGATLTVELTRLHTSDGQTVPIQTDTFQKRSEPDHRQDAEKVGVGAVIGAVIGGIAGGGKGAAIGAGAGAGAGGADAVLTRKAAALPSETRLSFRLRAPVPLTERR